MTIAGSSMASSGCCAPALPGGTCRGAMDRGKRWTVASPAGARLALGSGAGRAPTASGRGGEVGLADPLRGWHHRAGPPTCGRGKGGDPEAEALGRSRGGFGTKVHLRAEGNGKLMTLVLTPGQWHEAPLFPQLLEQGAVKRSGGGCPKLRPGRMVGDKGYSSRENRSYARRRGIRITIPRRENERRRGPFDREIYRLRNRSSGADDQSVEAVSADSDPP